MPRTLQRTEFATAVEELARERHIDAEAIIKAIIEAILAAFEKDYQEKNGVFPEGDYEVIIDEKTGEAKVFVKGKKGKEEVTPPGFGRIATQVAKQVIIQKVREAEKMAVIDDYQGKIGTVVQGTVIRFDDYQKQAIIDIGRTYGFLPPSEQLKGEDYLPGVKFDFYIKEISGEGEERRIILSRATRELVEALFRREVPEIANGTVEIRAIAREPGVRTKIAVYSKRRNVDPVGACVGQKGVRVAQVINSLGGEKIDVIQYSNNPQEMIEAALLPAENLKIEIDEKEKRAKVLAPEDQLSLAIGKNGQNVRLASELTGYEIDIEEEGGRKRLKKSGESKAKESQRDGNK